MEENWEDETAGGAAAAAAAAEAAPATMVAEMPEVKLFGKWSCDDVEVVDMSLQVRKKSRMSSMLHLKMMFQYPQRVMCLP